ncbi:MAG: SpoIID/LytB domain-containing protein [Oscillospiraceae bacterium]|nr:SpoIID/LytB domain-containing protein [Oscillospiraceae bacterium]
MKEKFTVKRMIIVVVLVALYATAFYMISEFAKSTILNEVESQNYIKVNNTVVNETPYSYDSEENAEEIVSKADINQYPELVPEATRVTTVTTVTTSETTPPTSVTTLPSVTTPDTTTKITTTVTTTEEEVTTVPTTTEKETTTTEEDDDEGIVIIDDEEEIVDEDYDYEIEDEEEEVTTLDDWTTLDDEWLASVLEEYYQSLGTSSTDDNVGIVLPEIGTPEFYPEDNLYTSNSWKDEILTIYNKKTGSYVTDTAFNLVCKITFNEVGTSMHEEAIKAQAVAAYTYLKYYLAKGEIPDISMKDEIPEKVLKCVEAVDGLAIYYDNEYIMSCFSASTGGYSASSENVWGGYRAYLRSVKNDYDYLDSKNYGRVTTYTLDEVKSKIESKTDIDLSGDPSQWIQILSHADNIYVDQLSIDGHTSAHVSGKERRLTGYVFRTYILGIRSTCFSVSYDNGVFTFVTYGYGHGVGMSQTGADLYATYGGYTFDQILHHYYTDVVIR